jgi:hypothetical protein
MMAKKIELLALGCCLAFLSTRIQANEELATAWIKGVPSKDTTIAAAAGDSSGCTFVTGDTAGNGGQGSPDLGQRDAYLRQYDLKGQEAWSCRFQKNGWSVAKSMVLCPDGSHDIVTVGCQGGPSGGRSCQAFLRRYSRFGDLVSIFASPEGYCGARAGVDSLQGAYALSDLQGVGVTSTLFKAQSPLTTAASGSQP